MSVQRSRSRRSSRRHHSRSRSRSYRRRSRSRSRSWRRRRSHSRSPMSNRRRHIGNRVCTCIFFKKYPRHSLSVKKYFIGVARSYKPLKKSYIFQQQAVVGESNRVCTCCVWVFLNNALIRLPFGVVCNLLKEIKFT